MNDKFLLTKDQFFDEKCVKTQIVLHHTASGPSAQNVIHGWQYNADKIGTAFVIDGSGEIYKAFEEDRWAYHLGLKASNNMRLQQGSIGIEICNWGQLILKDGKYLNYINKEVPASEVVELDYRGFKYYHAYTDAQIDSVKNLLIVLCEKYGIPKTHFEIMFDVNTSALSGTPGIWAHTSYRTDKVDINPQPKIIEMLKNL